MHIRTYTHTYTVTAFVQLSVASAHLAACAPVYLCRVPTGGSPSLHILVPGAQHVHLSGLQLFCTLQVNTQQTLAQTYNLAHILKYRNNFSYNWRKVHDLAGDAIIEGASVFACMYRGRAFANQL